MNSAVSALVAAAVVAWPQVTPQTILQDVPAFEWVGLPGAVQPASYRTAKPVPACPIYDDSGRVVGASLTCEALE